MSWGETLVEDIALVKGGKRLPSGHSFADSPTGHIYIRARDIGGGKIEIKEPVYLTEATLNILQHYTVKEGDVVVTIVGANVGDVGYVNEELSGANLTENAAKLVVDKSRYDPYFLKLLLATESSKKRLSFIASGAAQGKLGLYKIKSFPVVAPPIDIQRKIAAIGCNYDDLIENNRRRIQLLEKSARLFYREWFVRLRFPGHEHVEIIDGVPEGWEKKRLIDIVELIMGQSPKSKFYNDKGEGLPFHQGVTNFGERFVEHKTYCTAKNRIAEKGDILCSVRAPVGRLNITLDRIIIGRGLSSIRSKSGHQSFLYYNLKEHFFKENMIGGGAIFAAVTKKDMENQELLCPLTGVIEKYEYISNPIDEQIKVLHNQNIRLKQARDLLLPRLMNGEIKV